jgi:peptidoglycan hydrolase-like protein with peptidoglycan-binding domain
MLLKNGSKGEEVKQLQEKLGLSVDGHFGPGTETKVKEWQSANGLTADGIVGPGTWGKMFGTTTPEAAPISIQHLHLN